MREQAELQQRVSAATQSEQRHAAQHSARQLATGTIAGQQEVLAGQQSARRAAMRDCAASNLRAMQEKQEALRREKASPPPPGDFFGRFGTSLT